VAVVAPAAAPTPTLKPVRFRYTGAGATRVFVAGTFNQWHPTSAPLQPTASGWVLVLELPPGRYEYRFIVDGAWVSDPAAAASAPNPFGDTNSVVQVS
jgi:1,4-alpha-glucan branching enzyme